MEDVVTAYKRDGIAVVRGFSSGEETAMLREIAVRYARELHAAEVFTTREQQRRHGNKFLNSAHGIAAFLEEEAVDEDGHCVVSPPERAVNKIGHALHELDEEVSRCTSRAAAWTDALRMEQPLVVQSMFIFKQPHIGGAVREHRDSTFLWTDPPSCVAFWLALERAGIDNGCLWAVPGSHKDRVGKRFVRSGADGSGADDVALTMRGKELSRYDERSWKPYEVDEGDMVLIHGSLYHRSASNRSAHTRDDLTAVADRLAYTFHVVEGSSRYSEENWLQRPPEAPFRGFTAA